MHIHHLQPIASIIIFHARKKRGTREVWERERGREERGTEGGREEIEREGGREGGEREERGRMGGEREREGGGEEREREGGGEERGREGGGEERGREGREWDKRGMGERRKGCKHLLPGVLQEIVVGAALCRELEVHVDGPGVLPTLLPRLALRQEILVVPAGGGSYVG